MVAFSKDIDLLKYEPELFGALHLAWQVKTSGTNGVVSGTTFTSVGAGFVNAGVAAGDVIYLQGTGIDGAYEVVSVDSATQLKVSVLRADTDDESVAPPAGSSLTYRICTYAPQAAEAGMQITEYFEIAPGKPSSELDSDDILYPEVLKRASVFAILAAIFAMLANSAENDFYWKKSTYYEALFQKCKEKLRISIDTDGDGVEDKAKDGSTKRLSRE